MFTEANTQRNQWKVCMKLTITSSAHGLLSEEIEKFRVRRIFHEIISNAKKKKRKNSVKFKSGPRQNYHWIRVYYIISCVCVLSVQLSVCSYNYHRITRTNSFYQTFWMNSMPKLTTISIINWFPANLTTD